MASVRRTCGQSGPCAVFLTVLTLATPSFAQSATQPDRVGELILYDIETEIGIIARREFHDESGQLTKAIFYRYAHSTTAASEDATPVRVVSGPRGPVDPNHLAVHSTKTYDYDRGGWCVRESTYDPAGALTGYTTNRYDSEGNLLAIVDFNTDGRRVYETRFAPPQTPVTSRPAPSHPFKRGMTRSHLYFEESGERLIAVRGSL